MNAECVVVIDSLEQSLVAALPRLIRDELCRGLTQLGSVVSQQIASRLDLSVNNTSPVMLRAGSASLTPVSALQLLRSGQVNSAFEKVSALLPDHSCCVFKNKHICKVTRKSDVQCCDTSAWVIERASTHKNLATFPKSSFLENYRKKTKEEQAELHLETAVQWMVVVNSVF